MATIGQKYEDPVAADSAANLTVGNVIGNKTDTVAGDSIVALAKQSVADIAAALADILANTGEQVENTAIGFHTTAVPIFLATGAVEILGLVGRITTIVEAQATTIQLIAEDGVLADVDLTTNATDANGNDVDTLYWLTGDVSDPVQVVLDTVLAQEYGELGLTPILVRDCNVSLLSGAISTGAATWTAYWRPLEIGATLTAI